MYCSSPLTISYAEFFLWIQCHSYGICLFDRTDGILAVSSVCSCLDQESAAQNFSSLSIKAQNRNRSLASSVPHKNKQTRLLTRFLGILVSGVGRHYCLSVQYSQQILQFEHSIRLQLSVRPMFYARMSDCKAMLLRVYRNCAICVYILGLKFLY